MNWAVRTKNWLTHTLGIEPIIEFARYKHLPRHKHSMSCVIWHYLGGIVLILFIIQVATGLLLLFYYKPLLDIANESVIDIMTEVPFGWLIRSIHSWSANLMISVLFAHFFSVMLMKAYRHPREITWITGMFLLFLSLTMGFTGYLLPWTEVSFFATKVSTGLAKKVPLVGNYLFYLFRGSENVSGDTLTRFFGLHVCIIPLILSVCLAIHVWLVLAHGLSVPISAEHFHKQHKRRIPYLRNFFYRHLVIALVILGVIVTLSVFLPKGIARKPDPLMPTPAGIRPEWYFLFLFQTLKLLPAHILFIDGEVFGIMAIGLGLIFLFIVPFLDRKAHRSEKGYLFQAIAIVLMLYFVLFTLIGYISSASQAKTTITSESAHTMTDVAEAMEKLQQPLTFNHILGLIGFWSILLFVIVFLLLKIRHYDQLVKRGYYRTGIRN